MELGIVSLETAENINNEMSQISKILKNRVSYGLRYISFEDDLPYEICDELLKMDIIPVITWELYLPSLDGDNRRECSVKETRLDDLLEGKFDDYLDNFAKQAKKWGNTLYLRPLHEFNADWYVWGGLKNGANVEAARKIANCWRYIVERFKRNQTKNVKWIWCPHEPSMHVSGESWNKLKNYWPGDEYVDLLGIDGFNFYPENPEREKPPFCSFDSLFEEIYNEITFLSDKPIFIMTGTAEFSKVGDITCKSEWLDDAFNKIKTKYTKICIVGWFHFKYSNKIDWRVNSSIDSLNIFKKYFN